RPGVLSDLRDRVLRVSRLRTDQGHPGLTRGLRRTAALHGRGCGGVPRPGAGQTEHAGQLPHDQVPLSDHRCHQDGNASRPSTSLARPSLTRSEMSRAIRSESALSSRTRATAAAVGSSSEAKNSGSSSVTEVVNRSTLTPCRRSSAVWAVLSTSVIAPRSCRSVPAHLWVFGLVAEAGLPSRYQAQTSWSGQAAQSGLRAVQMRAPNSITPAFHCTWSRSGTNPAAQAVSFRPGDAVGRSLPAKRRMRTRRTFVSRTVVRRPWAKDATAAAV